MALKVVLGEDSYIVRQGIELMLESVDEVDLVASCEDMESLSAAVEAEAPDVVLTDIRMPPGLTDEGIQLAARLRRDFPETGVVILSQYAEPAYVLKLFESGSEGRAYLLKERVHSRAELVAALEAVADGRSVIDPKLVELMVSARARSESSPLGELTPRELEVLAALAEGLSNAAIAERLVLTKRAVEKHINAIFQKLGLSFGADTESISKRVRAALIYLSDRPEASSPEGD